MQESFFESVNDLPGVRRTYMKPRIAVFIPAHNEENSIRDCLAGLRDQSLPKDVEMDIYLAADNCTDRTEQVALEAAAEFNLQLKVLVTQNNKQRKVGALNTAWKRIYGDPLDLYDEKQTAYEVYYQSSVKAILGMDADSRLAPGALLQLWEGLMSSRNIGGVMAKYTMRMPKKKSILSKSDPHYEVKLATGEYGGPLSRWWTHQQKQDMASWLLDLQYSGGSTYVLGGQATLFRPEALQDVIEENKLDGPWQDECDVEDMLLTWQIQKRWKTLISPSARCYVDAMKSYHTFRQQRNKWQSGTVELLTNSNIGVRSKHRGKIWLSQAKVLMNLVIRLLIILLLVLSLSVDQFHWSWIWITPVVLASLLNTILALKTPMHRPIDVILAALLISPELYLWANLITFADTWTGKLSVNKKDGWAIQYSAERGQTKSKLAEGITAAAVLAAIGITAAVTQRDFLTSSAVQTAISPYLQSGWIALTYLTILSSLAMLYQTWKLRSRHQA